MSKAGGAARRSRKRSLRFWTAGSCSIVVLTAVTWILAEQARSPRELAAEAEAPAPSLITVQVRESRLVRTAALDCVAEAGQRIPLAVPSSSEAEKQIVTSLPVKAGTALSEGDVVIGVSGRPMIIIVGRLPAYRDLAPGSEGPDVEQVQGALIRLGLLGAGGATGVFDARTRQAVARLYKDRGYGVPGGSPAEQSDDAEPSSAPTASAPPKTRPYEGVTLPRAELVAVPRLPVHLGRIPVKVGEELKTGAIVLEGGKPVLRCPVPDLSVASALRKGAKVTVTSGQGQTGSGVVLRTVEAKKEGTGQAGDTSEVSGTEAIVRTAKRVETGEAYRARVQLGEASGPGLIVPASALWAKPGGRTVVKVSRAGREVEVEVVTEVEVEGQVLVSVVSGDLNEGDSVVVGSGS